MRVWNKEVGFAVRMKNNDELCKPPSFMVRALTFTKIAVLEYFFFGFYLIYYMINAHNLQSTLKCLNVFFIPIPSTATHIIITSRILLNGIHI